MAETAVQPRKVPCGITGRIEARVLGGFEVIAAGRHLTRADWQRASAERLVKLLLVTPGHHLAREVAAETLWPGAEPDASRANLRKALHFAGRALEAAADLTSRPGRVALDAGDLDLDLDRLRAAFDLLGAPPSSTDGEVERAIAVVLELGPRELLPDDAYEDWLGAPRERLQAQWQQVAIVAARRAFELGRIDQARAIADQLLDRDPTDEAAHRLIIELLAAEGRHHAARRQFEMCRHALRELLDVDPSDETVEAFGAAERAASRALGSNVRMPRLVARQSELERIESLLDRVADRRVAALVIHGPTGIGKTRLLNEVAGFGRAAGWRIVEWQALESSGAPAYGPISRGLAEGLTVEQVQTWAEPARSGIAAVAPSLTPLGGITFADRAALLEALLLAVEAVAQERPLVFAIDDLPWLDPSTLELLQHVVSGSTRAPILVATTARDDEPAPEPALRFLEQVRRAGGVDLALGPLALSDIEALIVGNLGGASVQPELARRAFDLSEGNPLFCLELVRAGRDRGRVRLAGERWTVVHTEQPRAGTRAASAVAAGQAPVALEETPETVRRLVANRSAQLSGPTLELVGTAAELGPEIPYATLQAILPDLPGGLLAALDSALASGLLVERGGGYAFMHPLYRLAVRGASGSARRAGTHLAVALALAGCRGDEPPAELQRHAASCADPSAAAEHALTAAELGAPGALPVAVAFGFSASERAVRLFDPPATTLLERSLAAWRMLPLSGASAFDASGAYASLANLRMYAGDEEGARASFHEAISAARTPEQLARAYTDYYWLPYRHGDFEGGLAIVEEALTRLPSDAPVARANVQRWVGWTLGRLHRMEESIEQLEDAVRVLEASDDRQGEMLTLDQLGIMLQLVRRSDEAIVRLERSLAIALDLRDPRGEAARLHLGTALTRAGHPGRARPHLERALEITHQMGDRYLESVAAWAIAEMEDELGNYPAAREIRVRELVLLASIGGNPHNEALSHAHLAHLARLTGDAATAEAEAAEARRLAPISPAPGYAARIEAALAVERWANLEAP